jgi:hypothetical protein
MRGKILSDRSVLQKIKVCVIEDLPVMSVSRTILCLRLLNMKVVIITFN